MPVSPDKILEPSTLPTRGTLIWTSALFVALSAIVVAAFLTLPSVFNFARVFPYILVVLVVWAIAFFTRMAIVGSLPIECDHLVPAALNRKLWVHGVWKLVWFSCTSFVIVGGVIAWAAGFPPQPFVLAVVILLIFNLVETVFLKAILEIGILRQHWATKSRQP